MTSMSAQSLRLGPHRWVQVPTPVPSHSQHRRMRSRAMPSTGVESIEDAEQRSQLDLQIDREQAETLPFPDVPHMPRLEMIPLRHTKACTLSCLPISPWLANTRATEYIPRVSRQRRSALHITEPANGTPHLGHVLLACMYLFAKTLSIISLWSLKAQERYWPQRHWPVYAVGDVCLTAALGGGEFTRVHRRETRAAGRRYWPWRDAGDEAFHLARACASLQIVHFIRHGQGFHNVFGEVDPEAYKSGKYEDAHLTVLGWHQVGAALR